MTEPVLSTVLTILLVVLVFIQLSHTEQFQHSVRQMIIKIKCGPLIHFSIVYF